MDRLIHDIQALPLWFSIPFGIAYVALIVYFFYVLWRYRQSSLKAYLLIAALLVGQKASADTPISHGGQNYTLFDSEGYYTATAGSEVPSAYTYEYLVDNVRVPQQYYQGFNYTYWLTDEDIAFTPKSIEFYSAEPIVPKGYRLRTACNTKDHPNRRPKAWSLKGKKHAGDEWTTLATETNAQLPAEAEVTADYWFDTDNTKTYQYFHFEVTDIQGDEKIPVSSKISYTRYRMELSELQLIGNSYSADHDLDYATISGLQHYYKYTGSDITPTFTVKDMSGTALTAGTDYTVSYSCNGNSVTTVNATGTYTLTITGRSPHFGQQTASFKVYQALAGKGTETVPYIIADANDWYVFGKYIHENVDHMAEKYYKLADYFDNSNEPITEMIATTKKDPNDGKTIHAPFYGTLDGNGRTLHIALKANSEDGCAPFRYLASATIQNLTVAGSVATSSKYGASIAVENLLNVGYTNGTEIIDCYSSVNITSSINGDGTNGGFVAVNQTDSKLTFTRCAFLGRMLGSTAHSNGGFVGWNESVGSITFTQCLFDPVWVSMSNTGSKTFSRYNTNAPSLDLQSYFTYAGWGTDQGTQAVALTTAPANLGSKGETHGKMTLYQNGLECDGKYYVPNLGLYDNASNATLLSQADGKLLDVTLSGRTLFKDGNWNTLCLPFDLSSAEVSPLLDGTSGKLMELDTDGTYDTDKQTGFDPTTGTLRLYFKDAKEIKAGTPYIIKWPSGTNLTDHKFQNVSIDNSDATLIRQTVESADGRVRFIGTFSPVELTIGDKSNLFLATNSENKSTLNYPSGGNNGDTDNPKYFVNACRAYFHVDLSKGTNVRAYSLHFGDDGTTGIVDNKRETITNNRWYTLDGRRLNSKPTTKGLYIYNGNKMVVK